MGEPKRTSPVQGKVDDLEYQHVEPALELNSLHCIPVRVEKSSKSEAVDLPPVKKDFGRVVAADLHHQSALVGLALDVTDGVSDCMLNALSQELFQIDYVILQVDAAPKPLSVAEFDPFACTR